VAHSFTNLLYHLVFATKDREPLLDEALRSSLYAQLGGIIKEKGGISLVVNGMPEHIHLLVKLRPDRSVSDILSDLKSRTSGWIHRTRPDLAHFRWQTGYGAFTVSHSQAPVVRKYIENQEEHHRSMPFELEYVQLMRKHGVELSEEELWQ
jgi:REP element-mobilizing transposase RayT